jgi:hypothetical protein
MRAMTIVIPRANLRDGWLKKVSFLLPLLSRDEYELRPKAKELGLAVHPGKRVSVRVVRK